MRFIRNTILSQLSNYCVATYAVILIENTKADLIIVYKNFILKMNEDKGSLSTLGGITQDKNIGISIF